PANQAASARHMGFSETGSSLQPAAAPRVSVRLGGARGVPSAHPESPTEAQPISYCGPSTGRVRCDYAGTGDRSLRLEIDGAAPVSGRRQRYCVLRDRHVRSNTLESNQPLKGARNESAAASVLFVGTSRGLADADRVPAPALTRSRPPDRGCRPGAACWPRAAAALLAKEHTVEPIIEHGQPTDPAEAAGGQLRAYQALHEFFTE